MTKGETSHKTTPYWWEAAPVASLPERPVEKTADVVIVGAGYAGLCAGLALARGGRSVVAFDRMHPGEGASSRNGGITSGNIRSDFTALSKKFGEDRALRIEAEGKMARDFLNAFVRDEGLACDLQVTGRFNGAIGREQYDTVARNAETLARKLDVESYAVPYAEQQKFVGTDHYRGGTIRMDIGGLHPARFHAEILRISRAAGVSVHSDTAVTAIDRQPDGIRVVTSRGTITAKQVLVCTNGYADAADPWLRRRLVPVRSRIVATEELPQETMDRLMPKRSMFGEYRKVGNYYRPSPDGKRILLGGRDAVQSGPSEAGAEALRGEIVKLFPELRDVRLTHSWWGLVAMHRDMLPRIFERDGVTYATGFCGSGVVWAPWIGHRAAYRMMGDAVQGASAFDFRPPPFIPLYAGKPWFMPALISLYRRQDQKAFARATR